MLALLGIIPQIIGLGSSVTDLFKQKAQAESDKQLREIDKEIEAVRDKRAVLVTEAGQKMSATMNAAIRLFLAVPSGIILWKLAFDKVGSSLSGCVKQWSNNPGCEIFYTDKLSVEEWAVVVAVVGFYFLYDIARKK